MTLADAVIPTIAPAEAEPPPPRRKLWTKDEYNKLVELGAFEGQRIYLFRGEIIEMPPQYQPHAFAVSRLNKALGKAFGLDTGFEIRIQLPFETPGQSMPEPDALVCTEAQNLRHPHPNEALLVVEVSDTSLASDREKGLEYAATGVREYWIVDVKNRRVEVYRDPVADSAAPFGFRYPLPKSVDAGGAIEPLARPGSSVDLAELFLPK